MDHRAKRVQSDFKKGEDVGADYSEEMREYYEYLSTQKTSSKTYSHVFKIYNDPIQREIVESLLFADADPIDIHLVFNIDPEVVETYRHLFFDTEEFISRLDKISYVERYDNKFGKELKLRSLNLGPDFIYFLYGNFIPKTKSQKELLKKIFLSSAYRTMNLNYNPLGSKVSTAALEQGKLMLKAYDALEKYAKDDSEDGMDLLKLVTKCGVESISKVEVNINTNDIV